MRVILSERDFFSSHEVTFRSYGGKCDVFWEILLCVLGISFPPGVGGKREPDLPVSIWVWREEVSDSDVVLWTLRRDC